MTNGRKQIVAIEGVDGTGKTTVARLLALRVGGVYMPTPPEGYGALRSFYEEPGRDPHARFDFYLGAIWEAHRNAAAAACSRIVVLDRYALSTRLYHEALIGTDLSAQMIIAGPPRIDVNIVLDANEQTVAERFRAKGMAGFDKRLEADRAFQSRLAVAFRNAGDVVINTTTASPDVVVARCVASIEAAVHGHDKLVGTIAELDARGLLETNTDAHAYDARLACLRFSARASSCVDAGIRFLALYDTLFRLVDVALARYGWAIGPQAPHQVMKAVVKAVVWDAPYFVSAIDRLVFLRHKVKKMGVVPEGQCVDDLAEIVGMVTKRVLL